MSKILRLGRDNLMIIGNPGVTPGNRKIVISTWVVAIIIIEMLGFYVHSVRPQVSYWKYSNHRNQYIILDAVVVEEKGNQIYYNDTFPIFKILKVKLEYQINGHTYYKWTDLYSDYVEGVCLKIAVANSDYYNIVRITPYHISEYEKRLYLKYIIFDVVLAGILCAWCVIDRRKYNKLVSEYNSKYGDITSFEQQAQKEKQDIIVKQKKILEILHKNAKDDEVCTAINISQYQKNNIHLNQGSLWYITEVSCYTVASNWLLLSKYNDVECEAVKKTLELKIKGLPEGYYVVDAVDTYYYCCTEASERLYVFSEALGITNTQYASIYDYIIEKIESKSFTMPKSLTEKYQ